MKIVKNRNRGFSLTELLIVITLIVIVLALALPAFNFITGSKSTDAAQNQISAMLGRARNEAIGVQELRGVFFYLDPGTEQYTVALVGQAKFGDPGASGTTYKAGDYVERPGSSTPPIPPTYFVAMTDTTSAPSNSPPTWAQTDEYAIDLIPDVDQLKLP